jgi:hypothetical protein
MTQLCVQGLPLDPRVYVKILLGLRPTPLGEKFFSIFHRNDYRNDLTSFNLDESIKEMVLLAEEGVWLNDRASAALDVWDSAVGHGESMARQMAVFQSLHNA